MHGIGREGFGANFIPIVVINPAFGRSMAKRIQENPPVKGSDIQIQCTCESC